jgi:hypothetical protein
MAERFGDQPEQVIRTRAHKAERINPGRQHFESSLTYAKDKNLERHAVADERELMRDALKRSICATASKGGKKAVVIYTVGKGRKSGDGGIVSCPLNSRHKQGLSS